MIGPFAQGAGGVDDRSPIGRDGGVAFVSGGRRDPGDPSGLEVQREQVAPALSDGAEDDHVPAWRDGERDIRVPR